jgi:hypothetical protein
MTVERVNLIRCIPLTGARRQLCNLGELGSFTETRPDGQVTPIPVVPETSIVRLLSTLS